MYYKMIVAVVMVVMIMVSSYMDNDRNISLKENYGVTDPSVRHEPSEKGWSVWPHLRIYHLFNNDLGFCYTNCLHSKLQNSDALTKFT